MVKKITKAFLVFACLFVLTLFGFGKVFGYGTSIPFGPFRDINFNQSGYRWFAASSSSAPSLPLTFQNQSAMVPTIGQPFRLRALIHVNDGNLEKYVVEASEKNSGSFKLQFSERIGKCDSSFKGEIYRDVSSNKGAIRFYNVAGAANGANAVRIAGDPEHGSHYTSAQTLVEQNPFYNLSSHIFAGEDGLWDFSLVNNSALPGISYCFRMVRLNGALLESYEAIPELRSLPLQPPPFEEEKELPLSALFFNLRQPPEATKPIISPLTGATAESGGITEDSVFVKSGDGKIDIALLSKKTDNGESIRWFKAVTEQGIQFNIIPSAYVNNITGRVIEESNNKLARVFSYSDEDDDGTYTALITMPEIAGNYRVETTLDFSGSKVNKNITVISTVDYKGYVYDQARIKNAAIFLYQFSEDKNDYVLWPAVEYSQENPQKTNLVGEYAFIVPPGLYKIKVEAAGYDSYDSEPVPVTLDNVISSPIGLKARFAPAFYLKWFLLTAFAGFLLFLLLFLFFRRKKDSLNNSPLS